METRPRPEQPTLWGADASPGLSPAPLPEPAERVIRAGSGPVLVGTSGFSFPDWDGVFYPRGLPPAKRLGFYARYFPALEVNSTYYRIPHPLVMRQLAEKTPRDFEIVVKANRGMTHEAGDGDVYREFLGCLAPLREAGRFQGVLAQFPWAFRRSPENLRRVLEMPARLDGAPLFVEFRHASWAAEEVFRSLADAGIGYCSVDEPALAGLMPPLARRTGDVAYVRLHGRNARTWWKGSRARDEGAGTARRDEGASKLRYDYDYRREELEEWLAKIKELAERAQKTYVFFNNCHAGQAARNARLMMDMLQGDLESRGA